MPSVVEKDFVVETILSGQQLNYLTFVETFELEHNNQIFLLHSLHSGL